MLGARGRFRSTDLRSLADEELMELVHGGEVRAFEVIFDRHSTSAFSLAYRMCGRRALAEDIVQDAFLSLWRSGGAMTRPRQRPLVGVERGPQPSDRRVPPAGCQGRPRRRPTRASPSACPAPDATDVEVERRDDARQVRGALDELPPDQRQVIELAYFGGFTHTQIAEMLDLPPVP